MKVQPPVKVSQDKITFDVSEIEAILQPRRWMLNRLSHVRFS